MSLSRKAIEEFKQICHDEFAVEFSDTDAELHARKVLEFSLLLSVAEGIDESDH